MIVERVSYVSNLRVNQKIDSFYILLFEHKVKIDNPSDFDKLIKSTQSIDQELFKEIYAQYEAREPSVELPFVNDNYLLFLLIFGAKKFALDLAWISEVLAIRSSTNGDSSLITTTYKNIIEDNFRSKANDFGIIMTYEDLIGAKLITWEERKHFYQKLVNRSFPFYSDDLLNIMALKAYDFVILEGDEQRESRFNNLQGFETIFLKSMEIFSSILQWLTIILLIGSLVYFYYEYIWFKRLVKDNSVFTGLLGIGGMVATFLFKGKLQNVFKLLLYRLCGYGIKNQGNN